MAGEAPKSGRFAWLQEKELRLWHMMLAAVLSTAVTVIVPLVVDWSNRKSDLISQRSQELVDTSAEFENTVNSLVKSGDSFETFAPARLAAVVLNVEAQLRALNRVMPVVTDRKQRELADDYARTLIVVRDMLQDGFSPDETRAFGLAAQKLVLTRDEFLAGLG